MAQPESGSNTIREYELKASLLRVVSSHPVDLESVRRIVSTEQPSGGLLLGKDSLSSALLRTSKTGNVDAAQCLLDHGAAVNWETRNQSPPALVFAVIYKHFDMVQLLLTHGADVNARDKKGRTALMTAAWNGSHDILNLLITRGADVNAKDLLGRNVLHNLAIDKLQNWNYEIVELLLNQKVSISGEGAWDELRRTPLHWACSTGKERLAQMLLSKNADVNATELRAKTSLFLAVAHGREIVVRMLLQNGADVHSKSDGGWMPLHQACESQFETIANILLEAGADVNAKLLNGLTPLHLAAQNGNIDILKCLLARPNIKVGVKDAFGLTALHRAAQRNHIDCLRLLNQDLNSLSDDALGASHGFTATIVEFGNFRNENKVYRKPVYEVLYGQESIDSTKPAFNIRPTDRATHFKWIHLPANNIAWVEKLFVNLFIEDGKDGSQDLRTLQGSLNHQHRGHQAHSWFMRPSCQVIPSRPNYNDQVTTLSQTPTIIINNEDPRVHVPGPTVVGNPSIRSNNNEDTRIHAPRSNPPQNSSTRYNINKSSPKEQPISFFLYMPYLHYESESGHLEMQKAILKSGRFSTAPHENHPRANSYDEMMIRGHLTASRVSLHVRRTLDQFFYPNISTVARDQDQVVRRYQAMQSETAATDFDPKMIMVDQLWIWVINDNLVVTAFPQRWRQQRDDPFCVLDGILDNINSKTGAPIASVYDLATVITTYCSSVFTDSVDVDVEDAGDNGEQYQFLRMFDASLGRVTDKESVLYRHLSAGFYRAAMSMEEARRSSQLPGDSESNGASRDSTAAENLLRIDLEFGLLLEIKDIRDELNMIAKVLDDHLRVLPDLLTVISDIYADQAKSQVDFRKRFRDQLRRTETCMKDVDRMDRHAERKYASIIDILDLKQKHASNTNAFEAMFARQQAEGSARQNQILMVFTIVTIIFLPLSFITGFFTINIQEFSSLSGNDDGRLPLAFVSKYVFGVGFAVSIPMIILALNLGNFLKSYNKVKAKWGKSYQKNSSGEGGRDSFNFREIEEIIESARRKSNERSPAGSQRLQQGISASRFP